MVNVWNWKFQRKRQELIDQFGGKCQNCGGTENLELAHKEPTGLNGRGRGSWHRYYDVRKNPEKYWLACKDCHKEYDREDRPMKILGVTVSHNLNHIAIECLQGIQALDLGSHQVHWMLLTESPYKGAGDMNIAFNQNKARQKAINETYDYMMIVESDIIIPKHALLTLLETEGDVIVGITPERPTKVKTDDFIVCMSWNHNNDARAHIDKLESFEMTGSDGYTCILVSRKVFSETEFPVVGSGDMGWYNVLHKKGFKVICQPRVRTYHKDIDGKIIKGRIGNE